MSRKQIRQQRASSANIGILNRQRAKNTNPQFFGKENNEDTILCFEINNLKSRQFANRQRDSFMDIREHRQTKPGTTSRIKNAEQIFNTRKLIIKRFIRKNLILRHYEA